MSAVVAVPRQPSLSVLENSSIPISNVFDPNMPHLSLVDLIIRVAQASKQNDDLYTAANELLKESVQLQLLDVNESYW